MQISQMLTEQKQHYLQCCFFSSPTTVDTCVIHSVYVCECVDICPIKMPASKGEKAEEREGEREKKK